MSALEVLNCEFDCGDVTRGDGTDVHAMHAGIRAAEPAGPQSPFSASWATPPESDAFQTGHGGPSPTEPGDDFGLLRSLPLVIPASLILWAVIAAAWIALK